MTDFAIQADGLTRYFGSMAAVAEVSLRVPPGSVYGYLGRNGAGKTTTIQMLMGLLSPTSGSLSVMGRDPFTEDVAMKRIVSYVPERIGLPGWMTVREYPTWCLHRTSGRTLSAVNTCPHPRRCGWPTLTARVCGCCARRRGPSLECRRTDR